MPIPDVDETFSPGWWMVRLARKLEGRQRRLEKLNDYFEGRPPLPQVSEETKEAYRRFLSKSRTNFAELIVEAPRERMTVTGFRPTGSDEEEGDPEAYRIWSGNNLEVEAAEVHEHMLALGDGYAIVGPPEGWESPDDPGDGLPVITSEDPRLIVTAHDPVRQSVIRAGLKMFNDPDEERDYAYLYLRGIDGDNGSIWVATRERRSKGGILRFSPSSFDIDEELSTLEMPFVDAPIVRFHNRRGFGEYENHTDLLDRINHMILQRLVIATMQAFRQRAVKGDLPTHDDAGKEIDYSKIFTADPGALWEIPADVELWESGQVDLGPILSAVKDDVRDLAAVTRTPLNYLNPESANQSAEGASLTREGLVFKTLDRMTRAGATWTQVQRLSFLWLGDEERSAPGHFETMWQAPDRPSLAERADAISKLADSVPWRTLMIDVMGFSPRQVDRMAAERATEAIIASIEALGDEPGDDED